MGQLSVGFVLFIDKPDFEESNWFDRNKRNTPSCVFEQPDFFC